MDSGQKSAFVPKSRTTIRIRGTLPSISSNQLLVSTGIPSVDKFISGVPVGSIFLVEEDWHRRYSKVLAKCFTAESIVSGHDTLIASETEDIQAFLQELPCPLDKISTESLGNDVQLKIAWRYQTHGNIDENLNPGKKLFSHNFDLSKCLPSDILNKENVTILDLKNKHQDAAGDSSSSYDKILSCIKLKLETSGLYTGGSKLPHTILRIIIDGMGSPLWTTKTRNPEKEMLQFLYILKSLLRSSFAVAFITAPTSIFEKSQISRIRRGCDIAIRLESFASSEKCSNPLYKEYHGLFHVERLIKLNSLASYTNKLENCTDLAFKMSRKHFTVEKLHLPPLLTDDHSQESFCSKKTYGNKSIDF